MLYLAVLRNHRGRYVEDPGRDGGTLERPSSCGCTAWNRSMDATRQ